MNQINLIINKIRYSEDLVLAYLFRFIEVKIEKNDKDYIQIQELKMKDEYNVMYELFNLHYIRTKLVFEKEGTINDELKMVNNFKGKLNPINQSFIMTPGTGITDDDNNKINKKAKKTKRKDDSSSEEEQQSLKELTKEGINKIQTRNSTEIEDFMVKIYL